MSESKANPFSPDFRGPSDLVKDRFGRVLGVGDYVHLALPAQVHPPIYEIVSIVPNLDPNAPPNTVILRLNSPFNLIARSSVVTQEVTRVQAASERASALSQQDGPKLVE